MAYLLSKLGPSCNVLIMYYRAFELTPCRELCLHICTYQGYCERLDGHLMLQNVPDGIIRPHLETGPSNAIVHSKHFGDSLA